MNAYLFSTDREACRFVINEYFLIGEDSSCPWNPAGASPRHAKIELNNGQFSLKDLRSASGTYLNDQKIVEAPLNEGDVIRVGESELIFSLQERLASPSFSLSSKNEVWNSTLARLGSASKTQHPILLLGPSGTGKEILAREIHQSSERSRGPFVSVNCSALTESLIESELFGHIKGSFTGAIADRKGAFESARRGTLFLDEIGDLPMHLQAKLLRALENKEIRPVGSDQTIETDVRILAATHQNLVGKIQSREFRADLYYRLNVIQIQAPSLFERLEDFDNLLYSFGKEMKVRFSFNAIERLKKHSWPGNIRELRNVVARASALYPRETIQEEHIDTMLDKLTVGAPGEITESSGQVLPLMKEMERQLILKKLSQNKGNQRRTAMDLGIPKSTLHDRLRTYQIDPRNYSQA